MSFEGSTAMYGYHHRQLCWTIAKLSALQINMRFGNQARNQPRKIRNADEIA
jgi:hypothetical protein